VTSNLTDRVRDLVTAENNKDDKIADRILSPNFIAITRGKGIEERRDDLLRAIANPENPDILRQIVPDELWERASDNLGVVRSVITTHNRSNPGTILGRFRNLVKAGSTAYRRGGATSYQSAEA
jgi:hypothetical protein